MCQQDPGELQSWCKHIHYDSTIRCFLNSCFLTVVFLNSTHSPFKMNGIAHCFLQVDYSTFCCLITEHQQPQKTTDMLLCLHPSLKRPQTALTSRNRPSGPPVAVQSLLAHLAEAFIWSDLQFTLQGQSPWSKLRCPDQGHNDEISQTNLWGVWTCKLWLPLLFINHRDTTALWWFTLIYILCRVCGRLEHVDTSVRMIMSYKHTTLYYLLSYCCSSI